MISPRLRCLTGALLLFLPATARGESAPPVRVADVGGGDSVHHALAATKTGELVSVFSRGGRVARDMRITRSTDRGRTWSPPAPLAVFGAPDAYVYPGALTTLRDGRILLSWSAPEETRVPWYALSADAGRTWSKAARVLPENCGAHCTHRYPILELSARQWVFALYDRTVAYDPQSGQVTPFGDGRRHSMVPIVRTAAGTLLSGATGQRLESGLRSTDGGKSWRPLHAFAHHDFGFPYDLTPLANGQIVLTAIIYDSMPLDEKSVDLGYQLIVSRDDGRTWDYDHAVEIFKPGRQIGGPRGGWPRTVQIDGETVGTLFFDLTKDQPGGPGLFFVQTPVAKLRLSAR